MVAVTNKQISESIAGLQALANVALPVPTAFKISKTIRVVGAAHDDIQTTRRKILEKHAKRDDKNNIVYLPGPLSGQVDVLDMAAFSADLEELNAQPVQLEISKISLKDLGDAPFPIGHFVALAWLIDE